MRVYKYYTYWQIQRVRAKDLKTTEDKLNQMELFLLKESTMSNLKRVINWANGLNLTVKDPKIDEFKKEILSRRYNYQADREESFDSFEKDDLMKLYKDLKRRADKWAKNHYYNCDLLGYLQKLALYLGENISELIDRSLHDKEKSTHKFLF